MLSKIKTCARYRAALTDAVAAGGEPSPELRKHVRACASCSEFFAEEVQLFASIDTGLHVAANAEVRPTFLAQVRVRVEQASFPERRWSSMLIFSAAGAAVLLAIVVIAWPRLRSNPKEAKQVFATQSQGEHQTSPGKAETALPAMVTSPGVRKIPQRRNIGRQNYGSSNGLEVIVPPEERLALAHFAAATFQSNDEVLTLIKPAIEKKDGLMSVTPLEIAALEVQRIESLQSEAPNSQEENR